VNRLNATELDSALHCIS